MEPDDGDRDKVLLNDSDERPRSAVNSVVLDYYKKFGRKRDLEQYFSLSTAQSDIRDPRSLFWRRMKEQSDSDSGEKRSESSNEICRISIKCSVPEASETKRHTSPLKSDSESPPIITDVAPRLSHSGDESNDDNQSQKSVDETFDTSMNKPLSPTSSVTSQRKLEWDSLADVGYGNESDRKTSASSLSTLEREVLAQKQQYTLDTKQSSDLGLPTAHSTPADPNDSKSKGKKGQGKKTTTFSKKDVEIVEFTVPQNENAPSINVNLTKQFSVNLEKDGGITFENIKKDINVSPEKGSVDKEVNTQVKMDKEIQTSLLRSKDKLHSSSNRSEQAETSAQKVPILISLNTLRRKQRRRKIRSMKTRMRNKRRLTVRKEIPEKQKNAEQVSEAESFEYMPGHMYNQNQLDGNPNRQNNNNAGNKSSLESSAVHTTDSSKESKYSFTKDLENSLDILKSALQNRYDSNLKKKLVKEIIQRLLKSKYRDDDSTPDFISVLSLTSKKTPTTSTSEADNTDGKVPRAKPKKSILRVNKFNSNDIASTSQSAPNLPSVVDSEKPPLPYTHKQLSSTTTDTEVSVDNSKDRTSSDAVFARTSSEELYKKYIDALKREEAYKKHLKDKELFLRQKLVRSDTTLKTPVQLDTKTNKRLKELIKDLTRNNYDDGSGDASKLEGGSSSNIDINKHKVMRKQRSHSVFTLSSGNSDIQPRKCVKSREQRDNSASNKAGPSNPPEYGSSSEKRHECVKTNVTDSSVQVNIKINDGSENSHIHTKNARAMSPRPCAATDLSDAVKYVCLCTERALASQHCPEDFMIYKCSRIAGQVPVTRRVIPDTLNMECSGACASAKNYPIEKFYPRDESERIKNICLKETSSSENVPLSGKISKMSQTNIKMALSNPLEPSSPRNATSSLKGRLLNEGQARIDYGDTCSNPVGNKDDRMIQEATRCLQTEISIHPKISDPSLSDINIINSADCVKLISELYRKVSRSSSESKTCQCSNERDDANTNMSCTSSKERDRYNYSTDENVGTPPFMNKKSEEKNKLPSRVCDINLTKKQPENVPDDIVIPIQGTNMTLKVSIAGGLQKPSNNQTMKDIESQNVGIGTDKIENIANFTSVNAECSKAVQSKASDEVGQNKCRFKSDIENEETLVQLNNSSLANQPPPSNVDSKRNTYPKNNPVNERKPLLRSNTDTGNLPSQCIQTDRIHSSNKDTEPRYSIKNPQNTANTLPSGINPEIPTQELKAHFDYATIDNSQHTTDEKKQNSEEQHSSSTKTLVLSDNRFSETNSRKSKTEMLSSMVTDEGASKDLILDMIQDITKRYSKKDLEKTDKKKCFKEIITVLNHLLDTDTDSGDTGDGEGDLFQTSGTSKNRKSKNHRRDSEVHSNRQAQNTPVEIDKASKDKKSPRKANKIEKTDKGVEKSQTNSPRRKQRLEKGVPKSLAKGSSFEGSDMSDTKEVPGNDACRKQSTSTTSSNNDDEKKTYEQPTTCDKSCECGCEGDLDCSDNSHADSKCQRGESLASEQQESKDKYINIDEAKKATCEKHDTCDKSCECGCDDFNCGYDFGNDAKCTTEESRSSKKRDTKERSSDSDSIRHGLKKISSEQPSTCDKKTSSEQPNTCDKSCDCGCEGSDCRENSEGDLKCNKQDALKNKKTSTSSSTSCKYKPKQNPTKEPSTCDKSCSCGCEESLKDSSKCKNKRGDSVCSKKYGAHDRATNTSDSKYICRKGISKQVTGDKTCSCGCSDSECKESSDDLKCKHKSSKKNDENKNQVQTKRGRGCDHSTDRKESSEQDCTKSKSDAQFSRCKKGNNKSPKKLVSKCVQSTARKVKSMYCQRNDSSDVLVSTDQPCTSTDSPTARIINKIKKECEKYQKRCKIHCGKKCEASSSTSPNCDHCERAPPCSCKGYKCRGHRTKTTMEKVKRKCVAYNLILQTSDSMVSEENNFDKHCRRLQNIVVRVPKCKQKNVPFKEISAKIEKNLPSSPRCHPNIRSNSWPNESGISSTDDVKMAQAYTVRDYLERNRPDFVERCATRQNCIKMINDSRPECSSACPRLNMVVIHNPNCMSCTGSTNMYCTGGMNYNCAGPSNPCAPCNPCVPCDPCMPSMPCDPCTIEKEVTTIASERAKQREMLSMQLGSTAALTGDELLYLAKKLGLGRRQSVHPKIISEREMKQHSEKIYKSLPEVVQKKEDAKKESIKKTNLLMASIFKKNLQKKTLRGSVNLSNYSTVIKI